MKTFPHYAFWGENHPVKCVAFATPPRRGMETGCQIPLLGGVPSADGGVVYSMRIRLEEEVKK